MQFGETFSLLAIFELSPLPQVCIVGYFQPSLRDWSGVSDYPGLTSWANYSRPYGTFLRMRRSSLTAGLLGRIAVEIRISRSRDAAKATVRNQIDR